MTDAPEPEPPRREPLTPQARRQRGLLAAVVLALFAAMLAARVLVAGGLEQTALFYVGIPAVIALTVILTARPRHPAALAIATMTVGLALAGPLLGEGMVCLLFAAPLFYGLAAIVGLIVANTGRRRSLVLGPLLVVLLIEGVGGVSLVSREGTGDASAVVPVAPHQVAAALAGPPQYGPYETLLLRAVPFPEPLAAAGSGLEVGDTREVTFTDRRSLRPGAAATPREMVLRVAESSVGPDGGHVVFDVVVDTTLARWLDLRSARAAWSAADGGTRLTWELEYRRTVDPSWYFGPVQAHLTDRAADYLLVTFTDAALADDRSAADLHAGGPAGT